jgi:hypothetical protein
VFRVTSSLLVFRSKFYTHFSFPTYVLYVPHIIIYYVTFRNKLLFLTVRSCEPPPNTKVDYPLSAVRDCSFNIFAATVHIQRPSPASATRGRAVPWWQREVRQINKTKPIFICSHLHSNLANLWIHVHIAPMTCPCAKSTLTQDQKESHNSIYSFSLTDKRYEGTGN